MDEITSRPFRRDQKHELGFLCDELIGLRLKVLDSSCKGLRGLEGTVQDETENILVLRTAKGDKKVAAR